MLTENQRPWHVLSEAEVLDILQSRADSGLSEMGVQNRRKKSGFNRLTQKVGTNS